MRLANTLAALLFVFSQSAYAISGGYAEPIELAVNRWLAVQKPSGFMPYGFDFLADEESEPKTMSAPNLTRQTGAASTLADYYALTKDQRAAPAIQRALAAFGRHSLPIGKSGAQALLEKTRLLSLPVGRYKLQRALKRFDLLYEKEGAGKVLSPNREYAKAFTGATALALLTEVRYSQTSGDHRFADLRRAWLEGLISLWIPGEGFRQIADSIDTTPYFDGEAWLALAHYYRAFPQDKRARELLADVDAVLMKKYGGPFALQPFHWSTMAAAARYADTRDKRFLDFIRHQTAGFVERKKGKVDNYNGCASAEGVADALGALKTAGEGNSELATQARSWIEKEMRKARQLQIQPGQKELVFANARVTVPRMQEFVGSFRSGIYRADTQVDYTQHCLSAMLKLTRDDEAPGRN